MENVIQRGYSERVPGYSFNNEDDDMWYIPYNGLHHNKKPEKIRVAFDCSSTFKNQLLNQHLSQGPYLPNPLVGVLCRLRKETVAFASSPICTTFGLKQAANDEKLNLEQMQNTLFEMISMCLPLMKQHD